jgi:hypothetical protein
MGDSMTNTALLEPCPFCGQEPERNSSYAWCHGKDAEGVRQHLTVQQPLDIWNTRAASPPQINEELIERLRQLHAEATEPHPKQETSDRSCAVTMQNVNAHNHNGWVERITKARLKLTDAIPELLEALATQRPVASSELMRLRQALELARNRLRAAAVNEAPKGTREYYEYSEWADEADKALASASVSGEVETASTEAPLSNTKGASARLDEGTS